MADVSVLERQLAEQARQFSELQDQAKAQAVQVATLSAESVAAEGRAVEAKRQYALVQAKLADANLRRVAAEQMRLQVERELAQLRAEHRLVVSSTMWQASRPLRRLGAMLPPRQRRALVLGVRLVWWTLTLQLRARWRDRKALMPTVHQGAGDAVPILAVGRSLSARFEALQALRTYPNPGSRRRLSIVTDSINAGYLYGGVGTAIILATLLANRLGADLRLITRVHEADPGQVGTFLGNVGIPINGELTCLFSATREGADVPVAASDMFLTTSWWTTLATKRAVDPRRIVYLLQEDERMFYPHGDERLRCAETLASDDIHFVVNTELLFRHLTERDPALANIANRGIWFEPAFPLASYHDGELAQRRRNPKNFLFYARPGNLRNLYWRGLEAIAAALHDGSLQPEEWIFTFAGRDLQPVLLPFGVRPTLLENLSWPDYAALIRRTDLGLALIDTPHPSYPPLDLAASGAVAVTNQCGAKISLAAYSQNILCVPSSVVGLSQGLREGAHLAADLRLRAANYARNDIMRDWTTALEPTVQRCLEWLGKAYAG